MAILGLSLATNNQTLTRKSAKTQPSQSTLNLKIAMQMNLNYLHEGVAIGFYLFGSSVLGL